MPMTTEQGPAPWSVKEVATACQVVRTAAPRKLQQFEDRLWLLLRALRALDGRSRSCDLAASVTSLLATGGKLADLDRQRLELRVRELLERMDAQQHSP